MNDAHTVTDVGNMTVEVFPASALEAVRHNADTTDVVWDDLPPDERECLVALVSEAFTRLASNVEEWLPMACVARTGMGFGCFLYWKNRYLEEEMVTMRARFQREAAQRREALEEIAGRSRVVDDTTS